MEQPLFLLIAFSVIVSFALLIWFIITLNSINRNTKTIAEYIRSLALCHPPTKEQARVINRDLSVEEVLAKLAAGGATVRLTAPSEMTPSEMPDLHPEGRRLRFDNPGTADPEMLRFVDEHRDDVIRFLKKSQPK